MSEVIMHNFASNRCNPSRNPSFNRANPIENLAAVVYEIESALQMNEKFAGGGFTVCMEPRSPSPVKNASVSLFLPQTSTQMLPP